MITTNNTITNYTTYNKSTSIISIINQKIKEEEKNSLGITIILIMLSTMIASITVGFALYKELSLFPLAFACITAMGTNATAFSQSPFKYVVWSAIISILGNSFLVFYQMFTLFF